MREDLLSFIDSSHRSRHSRARFEVYDSFIRTFGLRLMPVACAPLVSGSCSVALAIIGFYLLDWAIRTWKAGDSGRRFSYPHLAICSRPICLGSMLPIIVWCRFDVRLNH